jgi:hypothetical protein
MTELIPVISDLQAPYQDNRAVAAVATFIADRNLNSVCVGDAMDAPQMSRWHRGAKGEFTGTVGKDRNTTLGLLRDLRVKHLTRSNHDDRLENYVREFAPALYGDPELPEYRFENFMRLDTIGCEFHREPWSPAPGWLLLHGDESGLSQIPGTTAMGLAKKTGMSVVCGHTHRLGLQHQGAAFGGKVLRQLWGFEVGNLMDLKKATYLKGGIANWQQGFGILAVDGKDVTPIPVPIKDGKFYFDGKVWKG